MMWGIIGVVTTIIIGLLPLIFRRNKRQCRITYIPTESFSLYNTLVNNFESLEILNSKQPILNNLVFISGTFVCSGNMDIIVKNHMIKLGLPEGCKWIDAKLCKFSRDLNPSIKKYDDVPKEIDVLFDLFKKDEYISFQALVECEDRSYLENALGLNNKLFFFHRIPNTEEIKVGEAITKKKTWGSFLLSLFIMVLVTIPFFFVFFDYYKLDYIVFKDKGTCDEYYAYISEENTVALQERNIWSVILEMPSKEIPLDEFKSNYQSLYIYNFFNPRTMGYIIIICFVLLLFLSILLPDFLSIRRNNQLYSLYHSLEDEN